MCSLGMLLLLLLQDPREYFILRFRCISMQSRAARRKGPLVSCLDSFSRQLDRGFCFAPSAWLPGCLAALFASLDFRNAHLQTRLLAWKIQPHPRRQCCLPSITGSTTKIELARQRWNVTETRLTMTMWVDCTVLHCTGM